MPVSSGYRPAKMLAREGTHTGELQKQLLNRMPEAAIESMCGV